MAEPDRLAVAACGDLGGTWVGREHVSMQDGSPAESWYGPLLTTAACGIFSRRRGAWSSSTQILSGEWAVFGWLSKPQLNGWKCKCRAESALPAWQEQRIGTYLPPAAEHSSAPRAHALLPYARGSESGKPIGCDRMSATRQFKRLMGSLCSGLWLSDVACFRRIRLLLGQTLLLESAWSMPAAASKSYQKGSFVYERAAASVRIRSGSSNDGDQDH